MHVCSPAQLRVLDFPAFDSTLAYLTVQCNTRCISWSGGRFFFSVRGFTADSKYPTSGKYHGNSFMHEDGNHTHISAEEHSCNREYSSSLSVIKMKESFAVNQARFDKIIIESLWLTRENVISETSGPDLNVVRHFFSHYRYRYQHLFIRIFGVRNFDHSQI